ncbi:uncharacterized protein zgc:174888 [Dunckerocampus dactyliophorus]|uniref:uncharacterized protein zgc:174888 n=1 Tax=Dunckerocampus dactyliophorus TaxID=161453 RepID=UPI002404E9DF|nr:uncharacterized protein zgc:174888 [Dunckerocampus dactyliophorus]
MSLPVLLLLSLLTVQCGGCDFDWDVVKNVKTTIDANPTGFRTVFPKNYYVSHHYTKSMLCDTDPCCVFPAAIVLLESWNVLLSNLWHEHLNRSLVFDFKHTLERIIRKNKNTERFQEEIDPAQFSPLLSSPEELLKLTSEVFQRWLEVGCSPSIQVCDIPTLPPPMEKALLRPARVRLLTTRSISSSMEEVEWEQMIDVTPPPSGGAAASLSVRPASAWSLLLLGLYWWLSP